MIARIHWVFALVMFAFALAACGGSSSETPFPLEPDWAKLDAGAPPPNPHPIARPKKQDDRPKPSDDPNASGDDER